MTSREFTESLAFEHIEPDPARETVRLLGLLVTIMANVHRDRDAKPRPFTVEDFVPDPLAPPKSQREASVLAWMAAVAAKRKATADG